MKKTPLYEHHLALGGKIIDFGGWAMPCNTPTSLKNTRQQDESRAVDICHMGEIEIKGPQAFDSCNGS